MPASNGVNLGQIIKSIYASTCLSSLRQRLNESLCISVINSFIHLCGKRTEGNDIDAPIHNKSETIDEFT